jgi:hypothetical protein
VVTSPSTSMISFANRFAKKEFQYSRKEKKNHHSRWRKAWKQGNEGRSKRESENVRTRIRDGTQRRCRGAGGSMRSTSKHGRTGEEEEDDQEQHRHTELLHGLQPHRHKSTHESNGLGSLITSPKLHRPPPLDRSLNPTRLNPRLLQICYY